MASSNTLSTYIGYKAKRQGVQWDGGDNAPDWLRAWVQHNFRRTQLPPSTDGKYKKPGQCGTA